jgi:hypothetical protein
MPEVMLAPEWQNKFRRTLQLGKGRSRVMEFEPGVPVELSANEIDLLKSDIGKALHPVMRSASGKPKVLSENDVASEETDVTPSSR